MNGWKGGKDRTKETIGKESVDATLMTKWTEVSPHVESQKHSPQPMSGRSMDKNRWSVSVVDGFGSDVTFFIGLTAFLMSVCNAEVPSTWKARPDLQQQVMDGCKKFCRNFGVWTCLVPGRRCLNCSSKCWMDAEILAVGKNKHRMWFVGRASDGDSMSIRFSMLYAAAVLLMTMKVEYRID
ncbi:UNVERIFIED_CONTAM: hypothetical protein PYX00_006090 [Menopon gallinae]|uniref:Uncharacterized protein n=1 Tax=Menopon gallinae TaxID=328185 RepID=A0AAW2HUY0_9NEOP